MDRAALEQRADRAAQEWRKKANAEDLGTLLANFAESEAKRSSAGTATLADEIFNIASAWKGTNGGIYTIWAMAQEMALKLERRFNGAAQPSGICLTDIERLLVDYFEAQPSPMCLEEGGEWFVVLDEGNISLTSLAVAILQKFGMALSSTEGKCLLCNRPIGEHSMDTADICNSFIGGSK